MVGRNGQGCGAGGETLWYGGDTRTGRGPGGESSQFMLLGCQRKESGVLVASTLVEPSTDGFTQALIKNCYSLTQKIN